MKAAGSARTGVVLTVAAALAGLISAQPDARSAPAAPTRTVLEVGYVTVQACRAAWPREQWPQASVCREFGAPVSPRVTAEVGRPLVFTPAPRTPVTGDTLWVGPQASVTYLHSGAGTVRVRYEDAPSGQ